MEKSISLPKYQIIDPMTTTEELLTTIPSNTFVDITTNSTPAVNTTQLITQVTLPITIKEKIVTTSPEETTEVMTATVSVTVQPDIDWEQVNELYEQEVKKDTRLPIPALSSIVGLLVL